MIYERFTFKVRVQAAVGFGITTPWELKTRVPAVLGPPSRRDLLAVERYFYCARIACPENNLISGMNRLHVGRTDDASHR